MKILFTAILLFILYIFPSYGQLNTLHNHFRPGDVLIKQQVEFVDSGEAGDNKIWDFSRVKTINDQYTLTYSQPPMLNDSVYAMGDVQFSKDRVADNELVVGVEHNTMYYYHLINDSLLQIGHENPTIKLEYTSPMTLMRFPLNYRQTVVSDYKTKGIYSSTVDILTEGQMITTADAYGKMILPSGDTLSPVLRVRTIQTIFDKSPYMMQGSSDTDTTSLSKKRAAQLEICRWYSKGYRYPVFETIRRTQLSDNSEVFSTAFFFPPQDHLYLDTDPDNLALLEKLWDMDNKNNDKDSTAKTVTLSDIMSCKIYPNPVETVMNLEYDLKQDAKVSFELYSIEGLPVKRIKNQTKQAGKYTETIDCSSLRSNNYVLRITANNLVVNEIVIKK